MHGHAAARRPAPFARARLRPVTALLLMLALAACTTVGPDFKAPAARTESAWSAAGTAGLGNHPESVNGRSFWASFADATLLKLIDVADANSPTLQGSAELVEQATQVLRQDVGAARPGISLNPGFNFGQPSIASKLKNQNLGATTDQILGQISWEADFWGKWKRTTEADRAAIEASKAALGWARVSLEASVASAYVNVRLFERRLAVATASLKDQAENKRIAGARYRLGATTELDLRQAETQYEQLKAQLPSLQAALETYRHALSVLLGETPDHFLREYPVTGILPATPPALPLGAPADLLRARPDVQQAQFNAAMQSARIGQATAALYPSFSLSGSLGYSTTSGLSTLFQWDNRAVSYGAGFYLPLFDRGRIKAQIKVQDSVFRQAVLNYQNQVLKAQQEVEDALAQIQGGVAQMQSLDQAQQAAARSAVIAQAQYRAGQTDYTTVNATDQAHLQTADAVVQAQGGVLQAYISAYRALGGGWTPQPARAAGDKNQEQEHK